MNTLKVGLLLTALTMLFVFVGGAVGGRGGMIVAFALAAAMNFGSYWFSDKIVLGMYGAKPLDERDAPRLHMATARLCERAGLPMPRLYILEGAQPNAFATGRNPEHAAVAVTEGLLSLLDEDEVEGVIAHELAHIKHRDTLTMTLVASVAGAIMMLASMARWGMIFGAGRSDDREGGGGAAGLLVAALVAPIAATLIQMAISRAREFEADRLGAEIAGSPRGLMDALLKLERAADRIPSDASPATAHMFIVNPLHGGAFGALAGLFRTHPPTEQRVEALRALARR